MKFFLSFALVPFLFSSLVAKQVSDQYSFISKSSCNIDKFLKRIPTADGRGTIIVILDTGIDPSISGFQKTTEGKTKIIDLVDASGFGDIPLYKAKAYQDENYAIYQHPLLSFSLKSRSPLLENTWIGIFDESRLKTARISDLDGDGESKTKFGVLLIKDDNKSYTIIDINGDRDISNDNIVKSFRENQDVVFFPSPEYSRMGIAVNIYPSIPKITFSFDDNSHGTVVAGIACGYNIYGDSVNKTFNGIAPGAQLIGIKISNSAIENLSVSGSIKRALDYAAGLSKNQPRPVIVNLSFGISSELEEKAKIETYIDYLLEKHPNLYLCISNGNTGPGLSSTNQPASSRRAISIGAAFNKDIARDAYASEKEKTMLWNFSSRGGNILKPDIVAPGTSLSSVPLHSGDLIYSGTSMASPYVAGSIALLLSACLQEDAEGVKKGHYAQHIVKLALRKSAKPFLNYKESDIGSGMLDVYGAYKLLKQYRKRNFIPPLYNIIQYSSLGNNHIKGHAQYKTVNQVQETEDFLINAEFPKGNSFSKNPSSFFQIYKLRSTASWVKPIQNNIVLKGRNHAVLSVKYDKSKLLTPGYYFSKIIGYPVKSQSSSEASFEIPIMILSPFLLASNKKNSINLPKEAISDGEVKRYFFGIPENATGIQIQVIRPQGISLLVYVCNEDGHVVENITIDQNEPYGSKFIVPTEKLSTGIYEVCILTDMTSKPVSNSNFSLEVKLYQLSIHISAKLNHRIEGHVVNSSAEPEAADIFLSLEGYRRKFTDTLKPASFYRLPFVVSRETKNVSFDISFSKEDYILCTDIGAMVLTSNKKKIAFESFENRRTNISFPVNNPDDTLWLEIYFAFAIPTNNLSAVINIEERHFINRVSFDTYESLPTLFNPFSEVGFYFQDIPNKIPLPQGYEYLISASILSNSYLISRDYFSYSPR